MKKTRKQILLTLCGFVVLLAVYSLLIGCPLRQLFGIRCPMCGMTRAVLSLLRLDVRGAFGWHPIWPVVLILMPLYVVMELRRTGSGKIPGMLLIAALVVTFVIRLILRDPVVMPDLRDGLLSGLIIRLIGGK